MDLFTIRSYLFAVLLSMFWFFFCSIYQQHEDSSSGKISAWKWSYLIYIHVSLIVFWSHFTVKYVTLCFKPFVAKREFPRTHQIYIYWKTASLSTHFHKGRERDRERQRRKMPTETKIEAKFEMKKNVNHTNTQKKHPSKRKQQTHTFFSVYLNIYLSHIGQPTKPNTYNPLAHNYITIVSSSASLLFFFSRLSFVDIFFS